MPERPVDGRTERRILVVEDDPTVRRVVATYLVAAGFLVVESADGTDVLRRLTQTNPDLIVLDRMLPNGDGLELVQRIRALTPVPVVVLSALGSVEQRIEGLEAGVDDYLVKPFSPRELVLRVQMVLMRSLAEHGPEPAIEAGGFRLDPIDRIVTMNGRRLSLTARPFDLLRFLLRHPHQVFTREQLFTSVWHWEYGDLTTVTVHVRRVREQVEDDPTRPRHLITVWGVGYRFAP